MQRGRITERGRQDELLARSGLYRRLYKEQFTALPSVASGTRQGYSCSTRGRALLHGSIARATMSYMRTPTVTIRLDAELQRELDQLCRQLGRSRSDVVRDALRRQVALLRFERSRRALLPLAEARGILTDEDVFAIVS